MGLGGEGVSSYRVDRQESPPNSFDPLIAFFVRPTTSTSCKMPHPGDRESQPVWGLVTHGLACPFHSQLPFLHNLCNRCQE